MMNRSIPAKLNIEHIKKEAKSILKAHHLEKISACEPLRRLKHLSGKTDAQILATGVKLSDVQFAVSMEYGFKSWPDQ